VLGVPLLVWKGMAEGYDVFAFSQPSEVEREHLLGTYLICKESSGEMEHSAIAH